MSDEAAADQPEQKADATEAPKGATEQFEDLHDNLLHGYHELEATYHTTRDQVYDINRKVTHFIEEQPVLAVAAAFGIGYLIGKLANKRWFV